MDAGQQAARERVEALFRAFDRLTPDELARIGFRMAPDEERDPLLDAVDDAARRTGRVALVDEAREAARESVMRRYSSGTLHPTFAGLNWGLSQGTVEDRVGIAEALADAAAAAIVADALDPEVAQALAIDAAAITGLAAGDASDGSLARALREPPDPVLRRGRGARMARIAAVGLLATSTVTALLGLIGAAAVGVVAGVVAMTRRGRAGPRR